MKITSGRKIAYVVDCSFTHANIEKVVQLAKGADILFIEATSSKPTQYSPGFGIT